MVDDLMIALAAVALLVVWVVGAAATAAITGHRGLYDPDDMGILLLFWPVEALAHASHALTSAIRRRIEDRRWREVEV